MMRLKIIWPPHSLAAAEAIWLRVRVVSRWVDYRDERFRHWQLLPQPSREVLLASRAGLPLDLISRFSRESRKDVQDRLAITRALARLPIYAPAVEALTERVPTFGARWERGEILAGHGQAG